MDLSCLNVGDGVRRRLEAAVGRLSHAYIINGPVKETIHALADHLAKAYVCSSEGDKPCGVCSNCRKANGNIHPDIIRLSVLEDKRNILVDQVRQLRIDAYIRPNEAGRKVFIIEDAHTMNDSAQNALLKVLEDGPQYLSFLLLTENAQQLLPTIRSRCEILSLTACPNEGASEASEDLQRMATELAGLLTDGEERALLEYTIGLEGKKMDRETLLTFFDLVETALKKQLQKQPRKILSLLDHLRQVRHAALFNVGTGHLLGWLAAGR